MADKNAVGSTLGFVIARGFTQVGRFPALVGFDGSKRLFAELFADVDRPDVQPAGAYYKLITNLQAGQTIRIMQIYWPDAEPRTAFLQRLEGWENHKAEGQDILYQGLSLAARAAASSVPAPNIYRVCLPGRGRTCMVGRAAGYMCILRCTSKVFGCQRDPRTGL